MRSMLSPTLVWKSESIPAMASCSPIHDELVSTICPSSSSVPMATTSQRIGAPYADARSATTASPHRRPENSAPWIEGVSRWSPAT